MIAVLGSWASAIALRAFVARRANGLSWRFCSGAARSSAAKTRLFRDWFLVAVAATAIRHGVLKHQTTANSLHDLYMIAATCWSFYYCPEMLHAARTLDIAAYRTITYLILIKLSLSARQRDIARFDRMRESYGRPNGSLFTEMLGPNIGHSSRRDSRVGLPHRPKRLTRSLQI